MKHCVRQRHGAVASSRRGSTLLLALLVMTTVLVIAVSLSQLVAVEAILARANNETVVATYAAESGLEQGAYRTRVYGDAVSTLGKSPQVLSNQATWSRSATNNVGSLILRNLQKNLSRGFDFFDADMPNAAGGKESIIIDILDCDGSEWFELGFQRFDPTTYSFGTFFKSRFPCSASGAPGNSTTYTNNSSIVATSAYRLYIKYLQGNRSSISRLTITGCTGDNGAGTCNMTGVVDLTALGSYRGSTRTMDLVMPRFSPVSGVFNYGVFSECQIIKDPTNPSPAC